MDDKSGEARLYFILSIQRQLLQEIGAPVLIALPAGWCYIIYEIQEDDMTAGKIILFIVAGLLIIFGFLFVLGAFSASGGGVGWIVIGLILWGVAFLAIFLASRIKSAAPGNTQNVTYKVDLPANVAMDTLKCKSCGGTLGPENIQMVAGAPVVTCPYCKTTYQLTEEPKW